jgi:hypothetical protein
MNMLTIHPDNKTNIRINWYTILVPYFVTIATTTMAISEMLVLHMSQTSIMFTFSGVVLHLGA